jgi:hypothetical protein
MRSASWIVLVGLLVAVALGEPAAQKAPRRADTPQNSGYLVYGAGADSCAAWLREARGSSSRRVHVGWLLGFVSGAGWSAVGDQRDTTLDEATTFVTTFCLENPTLLLHQGAAALVRHLERPQ